MLKRKHLFVCLFDFIDLERMEILHEDFTRNFPAARRIDLCIYNAYANKQYK